MLVTVQFPIADVRCFATNTHRLPLPDWPDPRVNVDPQFVHYFGKAVERSKAPDLAWPDEGKFVYARRALRFVSSTEASQPARSQPLRCAFRRLFHDGGAVVRMEVGLARADYMQARSFSDVLLTIRNLVEVATHVTLPNAQTKPKPLIRQGKSLAKLYALASTARGNIAHSESLALVEAGEPLIIVLVRDDELLEQTSYPRGVVRLDPLTLRGPKALFCRLDTSAGSVRTWIVHPGLAGRAELRSLRLCLNRMHAERETLDLVLKQISRGNLLNPAEESAVELLERYFNDRLKIIRKSEWHGVEQSRIMEAIDAADTVIAPATRAQLISRYEGGRRQVWDKIEKFQQERRTTRAHYSININEGGVMTDKFVSVSGTGNLVNVADYMSNVTNTVTTNLAALEGKEEIASLIKQLTAEIDRISKQIDPVQLRKMGKNVEKLSEEAASPEPERRWYEVSLEGIKEAATAVGEVGGPVLKIAIQLAKLLLP